MYGHSRIRPILFLLLVLAMAMASALPAEAVRLKDIASFGGVRTNGLVGYGLVVGLPGTGDKSSSQFTIQSMANMLESMGVKVDRAALKPKNVAAVMVTVKMPASARPGSRLDATISSVGDATSLVGGVLLMTPLKGVDGGVYALCQGPLAVGGFSAAGEAATATKNVTTVGRIPGGAVVERGVPFSFNDQADISIQLAVEDFSTAKQVADSVNRSIGGQYAHAQDASSIKLAIPPQYQGNIVALMASLENLEVQPDSRAKVVVDEKTGTVVLGSNVSLSRVAVSHGNLNVVVSEQPQVSQPGAFAQGQTVVTPATGIGVREEQRRLVLMAGASIQELVDGLNAIGATPRDLISILRTMKSAGALHADLEVL
ncbi:MAG: flagellar basal body P-ring protein FlgI [Desulfomicrobium sp.]|nr:flagellar basal body P-ring protein FlgI [Pseudomonadota bacterium]MBV1714217.1 flagellar basal body P-ring protein FlgI [Desulfomicrobium sp.]MBU4570956.1 flagellar basal body P-ring protein FlgI [Pseudomonadota bacterium]MBU4594574.1 flagellar basal body P-ring protein FlgI [Pseudomonadota bacterium]MBV1718401.1 flagellar basal body P-ring protein FlgI [Desulfomicrobium sp.]